MNNVASSSSLDLARRVERHEERVRNELAALLLAGELLELVLYRLLGLVGDVGVLRVAEPLTDAPRWALNVCDVVCAFLSL